MKPKQDDFVSWTEDFRNGPPRLLAEGSDTAPAFSWLKSVFSGFST
jgi:hypothetical protein